MRRGIATLLLVVAILGCVGLGIWQVERRSEKLALIAQTERQLRQPPAPIPAPAEWGGIGRDDAYRPVTATGQFLQHDRFVQAVTELGGGFWVMTPLSSTRGFVLVNRGFVPADQRAKVTPPPAGTVTVRGLLRVTEPGGGFLRSNDPVAGRWYSRDTAAMGEDLGLSPIAPFFIDAERSGEEGWPRGGMTVVSFHNSHLIYALTWFSLALMFAYLGWRVRRRRPA